MRKIILLFFAILINIKSPAQFFFGPQAGLNIATLSGTELFVTSTTGVHAGLYFNIPLSDHFAVMPAVIYSTKEFKYDYTTSTTASQPDISGNNIASKVNLASPVYATLGYIDIPVFLTYWTSKQDGFFIQAGPQLSFLISDIALIGDLGYKFPFLLLLYARASTGFAKVQEGDFVKDSDAVHNLVIEDGAALTFEVI